MKPAGVALNELGYKPEVKPSTDGPCHLALY